MRHSALLKIAASHLMPILLILSIIVLFRGHNHPGGGFVGGLMAGSAFILHGMAFGIKVSKKKLNMNPFRVMGAGLFMALGAGLLPPMLNRGTFLQGLWGSVEVAGLALKIGTPLLFDAGVYLVVTGMVVLVASSIMEEES
jgi:multisubunit Na+/H+ antiporter MnhB subunit